MLADADTLMSDIHRNSYNSILVMLNSAEAFRSFKACRQTHRPTLSASCSLRRGAIGPELGCGAVQAAKHNAVRLRMMRFMTSAIAALGDNVSQHSAYFSVEHEIRPGIHAGRLAVNNGEHGAIRLCDQR